MVEFPHAAYLCLCLTHFLTAYHSCAENYFAGTFDLHKPIGLLHVCISSYIN